MTPGSGDVRPYYYVQGVDGMRRRATCWTKYAVPAPHQSTKSAKAKLLVNTTRNGGLRPPEGGILENMEWSTSGVSR